MNYEVAEEEPWLVEEGQRDLRERTKEFALRIIRMFSALPKTTESQVLGKQVLRSGTSIGANYRARDRPDGARQRGDGVVKRSVTARDIVEGELCRVPYGRLGEQFIAKIGDCLKEIDDEARQRGDGGSHAARVKRGEHLRVPAGRKCEQTAYWLELLTDVGILPTARLSDLQDETNQLLAIFTTISKNVKAKNR